VRLQYSAFTEMAYLLILAVVFIGYVVWKYWALLIGAGYDPTPMEKVYKMLDLAEVGAADIVYDLGSGDGRIVIAAAKRYGARAHGIEADPIRFLFSWCMVLLSGQKERICVHFGNFHKKHIADATVVTLFLYRSANEKLKHKFETELEPGTRIVSYVWQFEGWDTAVCLPEDRIYLYVKGEGGFHP
jgi:hypothetical protein